MTGETANDISSRRRHTWFIWILSDCREYAVVRTRPKNSCPTRKLLRIARFLLHGNVQRESEILWCCDQLECAKFEEIPIICSLKLINDFRVHIDFQLRWRVHDRMAVAIRSRCCLEPVCRLKKGCPLTMTEEYSQPVDGVLLSETFVSVFWGTVS